MRVKTIICLLIGLSVISCVKNEIETPKTTNSEEYFPLALGKYITYAIDSIVFDDAQGGNRQDTIHFEIKEEITDYQLTILGDTVFYIHRSRRESDAQPWQLKDVWTTGRSVLEAYRTEENLTFRKLAFPLDEGKKWIGTSYINPTTSVLIGTENVQAYQDWEAEVQDIDIADTVGDFMFQNGQVMHVIQTDTDDGSVKRYVFEKYARGIGMVSRVDTILDSRCIDLGDFTPCLGRPWVEHAGKGYILSQVMIEHN